jgi:hypothetical protein
MPRTVRGSLYPDAYPFYWNVAVLGKARPVAGTRAGELGKARALPELALGVYVPDRRELSAASHTGDG